MQPHDENFSRLDLAFANFLSQRLTAAITPAQQKNLQGLLALVSQQYSHGHSCITISDADKNLLIASGLVAVIPNNPALLLPLVIEENRLYLQRYWQYESRLARQLGEIAQRRFNYPKLDDALTGYFDKATTHIDWQRQAAKKALENAFCIITGGPGTGKTTTVCKILGLLQELNEQPLAIALAAPTGKAAMRLQEAIALGVQNLQCNEAIKQHIPRSALTLHRLLGSKPPSPYFKHDANNPLFYDLVIVDEASMIDLALMSKLVDALKPNARLILLGDKDQLASVESGFVLGDLIAALPNNTVELTQAYRFDSTIKKLAELVNQQDWQAAWGLLADAQNMPDSNIGLINSTDLISTIRNKRRHYLDLVKEGAEFSAIYEAYNHFQVLCANRHGNLGALAINQTLEHELFNHQAQLALSAWYAGRPVMMLQNNPALHLYNGDVGICLPDTDLHNELMVFFQRPDGSVKKYPPSRLPHCETAFALTIHKSQGSEFAEVLIVLPETINSVLSKELIYTGITRAKAAVKLVAKASVFAAALENQVQRSTGLAEKLTKTVSADQ
jgi:exodeoxyribonuclease V alpha subunit